MMTLAHTGDNKTRAAEILGISLKTLHNKLNKLRLRPKSRPERGAIVRGAAVRGAMRPAHVPSLAMIPLSRRPSSSARGYSCPHVILPCAPAR